MARPALITILILSLVLFGILSMSSVSVVGAVRDFNDKWYYVKLHTLWVGIGLILFSFFSIFPVEKLEKYALPSLLIAAIALFLVLIPGLGVKVLGARRWLVIGSFSFQPSELAKFSMCIYLASLLKRPANILKPFLLVVSTLAGLVMLQPDLGTTIVLVGIALLIYFGSGANLKPFLYIAPIILLLGISLILFSPYRRDRLMTYLNINSDPQGKSYHIRQALLAIGSGGLWGVGIGQSRQKYDFLPEVTSDSIFAIISEEVGYVGSVTLILVYLLLIMQGFEVAKHAKHTFSKLLALGITSWLGMQITINLAAMVALFPLTGIPLPFISYGGTSMILNLLASGILVNIAKQK